MSAGPTKTATVGDAYQKLCDMYGLDSNKIWIGTTAANKVLISALTKSADIAWGETTPVVVGHPIDAGDSYTLSGLYEIGYAWVRNTVAGDTATLIITPFQAYD